MKKNYNKWDFRFLANAKLIASYSKDRTKIGSVLVKDKRILTTGYNGFPSLIEDTEERLINRAIKLKYTIHAEMNSILHAGKHGINLQDSTCYIYGLTPCQECAKHIVVSGIKKVVYTIRSNHKNSPEWEEQFNFVKELFKESSIELIEYSDSSLSEFIKKETEL